MRATPRRNSYELLLRMENCDDAIPGIASGSCRVHGAAGADGDLGANAKGATGGRFGGPGRDVR